MTKYYYNNELIRTSKSHNNYTHAVIRERKGKVEVLACRSSKEGASRELNSLYNDMYKSRFENKENKINAMKNGRSHFFAKEGRRTFKVMIKPTDNLEEEMESLERIRRDAREFLEETSVVEIEAR